MAGFAGKLARTTATNAAATAQNALPQNAPPSRQLAALPTVTPNTASLGLNLGLNPAQRARYRQTHNLTAPGAANTAMTSAQNALPQPTPPATPAPAPSNQPQGINSPAHLQTITPPAATPTTAAPPTYQGALDAQFGTGNPFGMGAQGNPLDTAQSLAQYNLGKALAGIRARYGNAGLGNSGRESMAEGTAAGEMGANLGDILAQRGQQQAGLGLQAMLGAGQQQQGQQALGLQGAQGLGNIGQLLTGIGASEQSIPNINAIMNLLNMWSNFTGKGNFQQSGSSQSGFLAD